MTVEDDGVGTCKKTKLGLCCSRGPTTFPSQRCKVPQSRYVAPQPLSYQQLHSEARVFATDATLQLRNPSGGALSIDAEGMRIIASQMVASAGILRFNSLNAGSSYKADYFVFTHERMAIIIIPSTPVTALPVKIQVPLL